MTVSTEVDHNDYTGNGVTTTFPYTFRVFLKTDLMVQVADLNENIRTLALDTDYYVTGAGTYSGGSVVLTSPLASGWQISISRALPVTQETDLRNQGKFFAEVHEDAFDKLTMLIQQCFAWLGLALRKPSFIANYYDALNNRIRNLRDPSQAQDAATKHYVDDSVAGSVSHADDLFRRTLRVPEGYVNQVYPVTGRRDSLLGFDSLGNPVPIFSQTETGDLAFKLASHDPGLGGSLVGLQQGGTVQDGLGCVYLSAYGVFMQSVALIQAGNAVDHADGLQRAIDQAKALRVPLVIDIAEQIGPSAGRFIYVTKTIDISGLREIRGALFIATLPETFTPTYFTPDSPPRGVVLKNLNASYDASGKQYFSTTKGGQLLDTIDVASLRDYTDDKIIGQIHSTCYSHFNGALWGRRYGTGIRFANSYDNSFAGQVAVVDSGSINYYPLEIGSFPYIDRADESNSMTFPRILLHGNKFRDGSIVGSKINITAMHAEACVIGDISGLVKNDFDKFCPNGIASLVIGTVGGSIGNINNQVSQSSAAIGCMLFNMMGTDIANIYNNAGADILLSDIYFLKRKGSVGTVYSGGDVYTDGGSRLSIGVITTDKNLRNAAPYTRIEIAETGGDVSLNAGTIDNLTCRGSLTQNNYGAVKSGIVYGNVNLLASSELTNLTINGSFVSSANSPTLNNVTCNGSFTVNSGGTFSGCSLPGFTLKATVTSANFNDCSFSSAISVGVDNVRASFINCRTASFNFNNAVSPVIRVIGGSSGGASMSGVTNGAIIFDPSHAFSAGNTLSGWAIPSRVDVSFGTKTINPYTGRGWVLLYSGGVVTWKETQTFT